MSERIAALEAQLQEATETRQQIDLLNALASELCFGDPARAIELAERARQLSCEGEAATQPYLPGLAASLFNLARAHNQRGEYVESLSALMRAQPHYERLQDDAGLMWLYNEYGRIYYFLSDYANALAYFLKTQELARRIGHPNRQAGSLHNIGLVYLSTESYARALETLSAGLEIAQAAGDQWVEGFLLGGLAETHYHLKDFERALEYGLRSLELARASGLPSLINGVLLAVSWSYFELGRFEQAQSCLQEVVGSAQASGDRRALSEALRAVGEQANRRQLPAEALEPLAQALFLAQEMGEKALLANCYRALVDSYQQLGQYQQACEHHQKYHELDKAVFNEKSDLRLKVLTVAHHLDHARQEAEIYRLRNLMLQQELEAQRKSRETLEFLADHDHLTGLFNRRTFFQRGEALLARDGESQQPLAVMMIDVDNFKGVNDACGHLAGDEALTALATLLRRNLRPIDLICRYGGDEFAILLPEMDEAAAEKVAVRLAQKIAASDVGLGEGVRLRVSIGVAQKGPAHSLTLRELVAQADQALYAAKRSRPGRVCTYRKAHEAKAES